MRKYRIKEITSSHTGKRIFIPQHSFLFFFWLPWERTEWSDWDFPTLAEAEDFIREVQQPTVPPRIYEAK